MNTFTRPATHRFGVDALVVCAVRTSALCARLRCAHVCPSRPCSTPHPAAQCHTETQVRRIEWLCLFSFPTPNPLAPTFATSPSGREWQPCRRRGRETFSGDDSTPQVSCPQRAA